MTAYKAPLRDIRFVAHELLDIGSHYASLKSGQDATPDLVDAILEEFAKFAENEVAPLNRNGDEQGCRLEDGQVTTPDGFKEAYHQYVEAGWQALSEPQSLGGQGLPSSLSNLISEMLASANLAWAVFCIACHGAMRTLEAHGTEEQKALYLKQLVAGNWTGTMCLTEPHCGTDLGLMRTKAEPQADGSYAITGTKIFISTGEHDFTDNIVHIVLARIAGAPEGVGGISLFIVPKVLSNAEGELGERNSLGCGALEHKMGIHGNPTCVMNFDGAKGFLLGEPNRGLHAMFTFMNTARLGTAIQGMSHAELGFQKSYAYAMERLQMRSLSGPKNPDGPADPIIVHPDVRRMLLTQKAFAEGMRMFNTYIAMQLDLSEDHEDASVRAAASQRLDLLTPIGKAFSTEVGLESASLAVQCFGGHGYIREWGVEQNLRDARIGTIWEGTTGIQANDLLGRKVLGTGGEILKGFTEEVLGFCQAHVGHPELGQSVSVLLEHLDEFQGLTQLIGERAQQDPEEVGAASVSYLMFSGYIVLAYFWLRAAAVAYEKLNAGAADFYTAKLKVCKFYFDHLLPRTKTLAASIKAGGESMMSLEADHFQIN